MVRTASAKRPQRSAALSAPRRRPCRGESSPSSCRDGRTRSRSPRRSWHRVRAGSHSPRPSRDSTPLALVPYMVPTWLRSPLPRSSRPAPRAGRLRKGGLGAAVDDLEEEFAHGGIDGIADQIGVEGLEDGLAGQGSLPPWRPSGHARAADHLDQGLLDDAVLDVEGQFAGALLGRAPADPVGQTGDVLDFLGLGPPAFLGMGAGP